jgi:hypothetical protein
MITTRTTHVPVIKLSEVQAHELFISVILMDYRNFRSLSVVDHSVGYSCQPCLHIRHRPVRLFEVLHISRSFQSLCVYKNIVDALVNTVPLATREVSKACLASDHIVHELKVHHHGIVCANGHAGAYDRLIGN